MTSKKQTVKLCLLLAVFLLSIAINSIDVDKASAENRKVSKFNDISSADINGVYINYLYNCGIMVGFPDGGFHPTGSLTRAQAAVVITKAANLNISNQKPSGFKDVDNKHWAANYIAAAVEAGYLKGLGDGNYSPEQTLSRAQAMSLILRLSKPGDPGVELPQLADMDKKHWAARDMAIAIEAGLIEPNKDNQIQPDCPISRGELSRSLAVLLTSDPNLNSRQLNGTLIVNNGDVYLTNVNEQNNQRVSTTTQIKAGDQIETRSNGEAVINYPDGSSILIKPDSKLTIKTALGRAYIKQEGEPGIAVDSLEVELTQGTLFGGLANLGITGEKTGRLAVNSQIASTDSKYGLLAEATTPWYKTNQQNLIKLVMPWGQSQISGGFWSTSTSSNCCRMTILQGTGSLTARETTRNLGSGQSSTIDSSEGTPSHQKPMSTPDLQAWAGVRNWVQETGQNIITNQEAGPQTNQPGNQNVGDNLTRSINQALDNADKAGQNEPSGSGDSGSPTIDASPPVFKIATVGNNNCMITLSFDENIKNNTPDDISLKAAIALAVDGTNFETLSLQDAVTISGSSLIINLAEALTGNDNKIRVAANTIKDTKGNILTTGIETTLVTLPNPSPPSQWTWRSPLPNGNCIVSLKYWFGKYVGVGDSGTIVTSANGKEWTQRTSGTNEKLTSVNCNNAQWLAVGNKGIILSSIDGINWRFQGSGTTECLKAVAWNGYQWLIVGNSDTILGSLDGITWVKKSSGTGASLNDLEWGDNQWIAVGDNGIVLTSIDGTTWTKRDSGTINCINSVSKNILNWTAVGSEGTILTSPDGIVWTSQASGTTKRLANIAWNGSKWLATGEEGTAVTSSDGTSWRREFTRTEEYLYCACWNGTQWLAMTSAGYFLTSPDGLYWTTNTSGATDNLADIARNNQMWIAVGDHGSRYTSLDGISWSGGGYGSGITPNNDVSWNGDYWLTVGNHIKMASYDGTEWTMLGNPTLNIWNSVCWDGSQWISVGNNGCIESSTEWFSWTERESGTAADLLSVNWNGSQWLSLGRGIAPDSPAVILTSSDGINWTTQNSEVDNVIPKWLSDSSWDGNRWLVVGNDGIILSSADGVQWTMQDSSTLNNLNGIAWSGSQWMAVGDNGTILKSIDGVEWISEASGTNHDLTKALWNDNSWLVVGDNGTILESPTSDVSPPQYIGASVSNANKRVTLRFNEPIANNTKNLNTLKAAVMLATDGSTYRSLDENDSVTLSGSNLIVDLHNELSGNDNRIKVRAGCISDTAGNSLVTAIETDPLIVVPVPPPLVVDWTWRNPLPLPNNSYSVCYGSGQYVTVGDWGIIATSSDGVNWTEQVSGTNQWLNCVKWNGSQWLAVGNYGTILTSPDGMQWTLKTVDCMLHINSVSWNGSQWIAVGEGGCYIMTSDDGFNWQETSVQFDTATDLNSVAWNGNQWSVVGDDGTILTSTDGINWTKRTVEIRDNLFSVDWDGSQWLAVGVGLIVSSPDGVEWNLIMDSGDSYQDIKWNGSQWVVVGEDGIIMNSADGTNWTLQNSGTSSELWSATWNGRQWLVVGDNRTIISSDNGIDWIPLDVGVTEVLNKVNWNGSQWIAVGGNGTIISSDDAVNWTQQNSGITDNLYNIVWNDNKWMAVGPWGGIILSSSDGINWTKQVTGYEYRIEDIKWNGEQWIAVGGGTILSSTNGLDWTELARSTGGVPFHVNWNGNQWVAVGSWGTVLSSTDSITWTQCKSITNDFLISVIWDGNRWVSIGAEGTILTSFDGVNWTVQDVDIDIDPGCRLQDVSWNGEYWLVVGLGGTIFSSPDGENWTNHSSITYRGFTSIVWNGSSWIAVGHNGMIIQLN